MSEHASEDISQIHGVGFFYWAITRNPARHVIERGFIREVDPPYRWGKGIRVQLGKRHALELGVCRRRKFEHEYDAVREAVGGRDIYVPPPDIGDWEG